LAFKRLQSLHMKRRANGHERLIAAAQRLTIKVFAVRTERWV
jgi:hypothetical protein